MAVASPVPARGVPDPRQFARFTRNITNTVRSADDETHAHGMLWFPIAHDHAVSVGRIARVHGGGSEQEMSDAVRGSGIISALSPQTPWDDKAGNLINVQMAKHLARYGDVSGTFTASRAKARHIREGLHPSEVLNPARTGGTSHKTWNFFQNMAEPDDPGPVTIDRHAHDLAVGQRYGNEEGDTGERGLRSAGRYYNLVEAYHRAGKRLGMPPNQTQATAWLRWRQLSE